MTDHLKASKCGVCGLPVHPSESGVRHFGFYTAHSERRCVSLLLSRLEAAEGLVGEAEIPDEVEGASKALERLRDSFMTPQSDDPPGPWGAANDAAALLRSLAAKLAVAERALERMERALSDMTSGWRYIRQHHGDLYGVGWDRCENAARQALGENQ